jgi:hypothetical protein
VKKDINEKCRPNQFSCFLKCREFKYPIPLLSLQFTLSSSLKVLTIYDLQQEWKFPLRIPSVTFIWGPHVSSSLFSDNGYVYSSFKIRDHITPSYKRIHKTIVIYVLLFKHERNIACNKNSVPTPSASLRYPDHTRPRL